MLDSGSTPPQPPFYGFVGYVLLSETGRVGYLVRLGELGIE